MGQVLVHRCDVCYTNIEELPATSDNKYAATVTLDVTLKAERVNVTLNFDVGEGKMICSRCRWTALQSLVRDRQENPTKLYRSSSNEQPSTSG